MCSLMRGPGIGRGTLRGSEGAALRVLACVCPRLFLPAIEPEDVVRSLCRPLDADAPRPTNVMLGLLSCNGFAAFKPEKTRVLVQLQSNHDVCNAELACSQASPALLMSARSQASLAFESSARLYQHLGRHRPTAQPRAPVRCRVLALPPLRAGPV